MALIGLVVLVGAHWGWSVRDIRYSAGGPSLPLPPPSTIAVALLSGAIIHKKIPEIIVLPKKKQFYSSWIAIEALVAASAGLRRGGIVLARDPTKYLNIPYIRPENRRDISQWFSLQGFGLVYAPSAEICLASCYDTRVLEKYGIYEEDVRANLFSVTRIGSREGLVSILSTEIVGCSLVESTGRESSILYGSRGAYEHKTRLLEAEYWYPKDPIAFSATRIGKALYPEKKVQVEIPVSEYSSRNVIIAPDSPCPLKSGFKIAEFERETVCGKIIPLVFMGE